VIYSSKDVLNPSSLSEKSFETKERGISHNDDSVNDSPTCKSHELYLKMTEERRIQKEKLGFGSNKYNKKDERKSKYITDNNDGPPCTQMVDSSLSDREGEYIDNDSMDVPIKVSNKKSFIKSDYPNSSNNIPDEYDFQSSKNPEESTDEAVMSVNDNQSDIHEHFGEKVDESYFSKRRIRRSTGYENQRYEVLPGRENNDSPMSVVVKNVKSATNGTDAVIKAEKQTVTTYEIIDWEDVPESVRHHFRKKAADRLASGRNSGSLGIKFGNNRRLKKEGIDKKKTTCMLYLQADHLFHEQMGYSEEASIEMMTRHVQRVNSIYRPIGKLSTFLNFYYRKLSFFLISLYLHSFITRV